MMRDISKIFRFRNFGVYKEMRAFNRLLKQVTKDSFPKEERFCLLSQLWRAADSVVLNIAEGSERGSDRDFAHFLNIAHTSLNEIVACLDAALDSRYLTSDTHTLFLERAADMACQLTALRKAVLGRRPTVRQTSNLKAQTSSGYSRSIEPMKL